MKYILIHGGVISGVGKGIVSSSLGTLMKSLGLRVTAIKIDPYLNIDAGTFNPYEHGEVYVLDDGGEVDLDLGNYERFMGISMTSSNNITTGKIFQEVIQKERRGDYLGKTVQFIPHVTDHIINTVQKVALIATDGTEQEPEVCIIELGGTAGDIESMHFFEAFRQMEFRVGKENFVNIHVSLVPTPGSGEQKTKPLQNSVRTLRGLGLSPDLIICRCKTPIEESTKSKISVFCNVLQHQVISVHDVSSIYRVPLMLHDQKVTKQLRERLQLPKYVQSKLVLKKWRQLAVKSERNTREVKIALVGKYVAFEDAYVSVVKALKHSALAVSRKLVLNFIDSENLQPSMQDADPVKYYEAYQKLCSASGIIVPGGFGDRGVEGKIAAINWARNHNIPYLGICLGMQLAVVEFCRNVLKWENANSAEFDAQTKYPVVISMPEHHTVRVLYTSDT
jgi:CTP synthase